MPNIASILKNEIGRVARKEVRAETEALKKASAQYRSTIAGLKRQVLSLEREMKRLSRNGPGHRQKVGPASSDQKVRYSAKRLAAHRAKLGLSAKDYGTLIGVSALTIYKWEGGNVRPRASQLPAIAATRGLGKREATARLEELRR